MPAKPVQPLEFGALRRRLLQLVREMGPSSVREVHERIKLERDISFNAVATVLNRLVAQGLMERSGRPRHYRYTVNPAAATVRTR
ncbi:MAG: BlaI/MecI/CopY family transcriptional regulator, partial [Firmicutes bacterium]|nr:BlaI/MecI/CopY family transcriptional regulator [Bacillota bacterium]